MYVPPHFEESRAEVLHGFIARHPFGVLVTHGEAGLDANHLPFDLDPKAGARGILRAHVARPNPVWRSLSDGDEVLAIFRADDAYISPNWYPSKHETHKQVPTWNYSVVHAHGKITVRDDEGFVRDLVGQLTRTHEAGQPVPWRLDDAPENYLVSMMKAIVGLEVEITRLVGKFKLSQNRETRDRLSAAEALEKQGKASIGQAMLDSMRSPGA